MVSIDNGTSFLTVDFAETQKTMQKTQRKLRKGVDKRGKKWYTMQALEKSAQEKSNPTESRKGFQKTDEKKSEKTFGKPLDKRKEK